MLLNLLLKLMIVGIVEAVDLVSIIKAVDC